MKKQLFFLLICTFLWSSCGKDFFLKETKTMNNMQWSYDDIAEFDVLITDTTALYSIYLDITHSTDYTHQNVYVLVGTKFPSGEQLEKQLSFDLANEAGQWLGSCSDKQCTYRAVLQEHAFFEKTGTYSFSIEQYMRINPLPAIASITFLVEKVGRKEANK